MSNEMLNFFARHEQAHLYWKCNHVIRDPDLPEDENVFHYDYCPGCKEERGEDDD